jgi:hypothetical protein
MTRRFDLTDGRWGSDAVVASAQAVGSAVVAE